MKKNMEHKNNQGLGTSVVEKNEAHKAHYYERNSMESKHNNMSRGAENITKSMTSPHKDNWRRGHGKQGDGKHGTLPRKK